MKGLPFWELRLGIHTGPVVAGVIGKKKFAYDVWVIPLTLPLEWNQAGEPGKINISGRTHELVKDFFDFEYRGKIEAKTKGRLICIFTINQETTLQMRTLRNPNDKFWKLYNKKFG